MTMVVDFNMQEEDGRIPARLDSGEVLTVGDRVKVTDGEGTKCLAEIDEIFSEKRYVMVRPIEGTWEHEDVPA